VVPPIDQVPLLSRGSGPLNFRNVATACGGVLYGTLGRLLCKGSPRLFPLNTAPVVRRVGSTAATALRLFPRDRSPPGEVGVSTRNAPVRVSAVTLRVFEALAALVLQRAFWNDVRLHRHSQTAEFGE
jgi:hypothetical protein